jgi:radical SAM protein with 4Fe4S-binding SPASM domain
MSTPARSCELREFKIEVTYNCPLNCAHCSSDGRPSNGLEMSRENCLRILTEAAALGAKEVALSGGEPLCWPHILDAATAAVEGGLRTTIYTSGNTVEFAAKSKKLRSAGVERLIFSVFGATSTTHERVTRVAGSFNATTTAIQSACTAGFLVELHFVPMSTNYRELPAVAELGKKCGAANISVLRLVPQGRAALLQRRILNRVQNLELKKTVEDLRASGYQIRTGSPYNFLLLNSDPRCRAAIDRLVIGPDLSVCPCDAFKRISAASIAGTDGNSNLGTCTLADCWKRSPYLGAVRAHLTSGFEPPCAACNLLDRCASGCLAQKVLVEGKLKKRPDPDCLRLMAEGAP